MRLLDLVRVFVKETQRLGPVTAEISVLLADGELSLKIEDPSWPRLIWVPSNLSEEVFLGVEVEEPRDLQIAIRDLLEREVRPL